MIKNINWKGGEENVKNFYNENEAFGPFVQPKAK